jgi:hypothetical protein
VHSLLVLDQAQDKAALLKGATADSATMIAAEPLLVDGGAGEGEVASFIQNIESILASELIFLLDIVDDSGGSCSRSVGMTASAP